MHHTSLAPQTTLGQHFEGFSIMLFPFNAALLFWLLPSEFQLCIVIRKKGVCI